MVGSLLLLVRENYLRTVLSVWNMCIASWINNSTNTHTKYVTHFFSNCTKGAQYYVTLTWHVFLNLKLLWMKYHHSIYTLLDSAPSLRFIFLPAVVLIWTGELNRQRHLSYILKCMNGFHKCPKKLFKLLCTENFKISLFSVHSSSTYSTQQYFYYSTLVVFCSIL